MHTVYWMADCFVCPSQKHEAFGLVVAEALASGVPTVASKIGGIPEIIRHEKDGLLVTHYRNPSAIAHQILQIATRPELASRLARQGRQRIRSLFSWKHTAEQLAALYSSRNNKKNQTKTND
jgi:spore coat protein SA